MGRASPKGFVLLTLRSPSHLCARCLGLLNLVVNALLVYNRVYTLSELVTFAQTYLCVFNLATWALHGGVRESGD